MTEYMKMRQGMIYDCFDKEIGEEQARSHRLCDEYNSTQYDEGEKRTEILKKLFGGALLLLGLKELLIKNTADN